jgi:DNA-binding NarL/FixJ family response regulator
MRQFATGADEAPASAPPTSSSRERERSLLSQREREIVALVAQGFKNKEMAEKMFISEQTVKNHLHNIFDKLGVSDRLELALYAIHNNLHLGK